MKTTLAGLLALFGWALRAAESSDRYTIALAGDSIITRKLSVYEESEFLSMIERIRSADAAFTNIEMLFHDYESYPMASSGGTYMRAQPELVKDLVWAGFDLGGLANNHSGDYGPVAMLLTEKYVREAGITAAGVGKSLAEAREAKFLETGKARIALVSLASTFSDHSMAGKSRDDIPPRPGLSPLRHKVTNSVTRTQLEALRGIMKSLSMNVPDSGDSFTFRGERFVLADESGVLTEPHPGDMEEIAAIVRNAESLSDYTIVSIHAHEGDGDRSVPARFVVDFARRMIDEGRRRLRGARSSRSPGDRDLQGKTDLLQPRRLHLPERDPAAAAARELRSPRARRRQRTLGFQRRPLRSRPDGISRVCGDLGVGGGGGGLRGEGAFGVEAPPDLSRIRKASARPRTPPGRGRGALTKDNL
jgi:poly-gamma-glutamate capsule biosynthesis protein CapA/YwtB (metallophosphatase superfamily)